MPVRTRVEGRPAVCSTVTDRGAADRQTDGQLWTDGRLGREGTPVRAPSRTPHPRGRFPGVSSGHPCSSAASHSCRPCTRTWLCPCTSPGAARSCGAGEGPEAALSGCPSRAGVTACITGQKGQRRRSVARNTEPRRGLTRALHSDPRGPRDLTALCSPTHTWAPS